MANRSSESFRINESNYTRINEIKQSVKARVKGLPAYRPTTDEVISVMMALSDEQLIIETLVEICSPASDAKIQAIADEKKAAKSKKRK